MFAEAADRDLPQRRSSALQGAIQKLRGQKGDGRQPTGICRRLFKLSCKFNQQFDKFFGSEKPDFYFRHYSYHIFEHCQRKTKV